MTTVAGNRGGAGKVRHCFNCGEELGVYADYDPLDTCGKRECEHEAMDQRRAEREAEHERLDDRMGWNERW